MTELKAETQALLDLGRQGDDPSELAIERNRRELASKLAAGALGAAAVAGSTSKAVGASSTVGAWISSKALAIGGVVLVGGAVIGGYTLRRPMVAAPAAPVVARASAVAQPAVAVPPPAPVSEAPSPAPAEPVRAAPSAKAAGARSIQSELELIRAAQKQLHRGDARGALTLLGEHAQRFPSGTLSEEREASRVFALCQLGDAAGARAQAERFVRRSPNSPFVDRVRASCRSGAR